MNAKYYYTSVCKIICTLTLNSFRELPITEQKQGFLFFMFVQTLALIISVPDHSVKFSKSYRPKTERR